MQVEELEIQLAATHDSNRELHLEIESLNALLQQGLEGAGAGAGSVADNRTHERRLSPASKNASTPASRRERVTLPSDSTRDSSTISNASEGVFVHAYRYMRFGYQSLEGGAWAWYVCLLL